MLGRLQLAEHVARNVLLLHIIRMPIKGAGMADRQT
jgi:hypothetical protein